MKKKIFLIFIVLTLVSTALIAQSSSGGRSRSRNVSLTVTANVSADVIIQGGRAKDGSVTTGTFQGRTPFTQANLPKGTYSVTVSANGYTSQTQQVDLQGNQTLNFNLQAANFSLRVTSNVPSSQIFINNRSVGRGNVSLSYQPGSYRIRVSAPGYNDYNANIVLNENKVVNAVLQPSMGTVNISIPTTALDPRVNNARNQVRIFVDGSPQNATTLQLRPGRHAIRVTSGGLSSERMIEVQAGEVYTIEVFMGFNVNRN